MRKLKAAPPTIAQRLAAMDPDARDHCEQLIDMLLLCYAEPPEAAAVLLVKAVDDTQLTIATAHADDISASVLVSEAHALMGSLVVSDAPPRELFN